MCLADGSISSEGRVEIRVNGTWGTICATEFSTHDALVICHALGYHEARTSHPITFGTGNLPARFTLGCEGFENSLLDCPISISSCVSTTSAGVHCYHQKGQDFSSHPYIKVVYNICVVCRLSVGIAFFASFTGSHYFHAKYLNSNLAINSTYL